MISPAIAASIFKSLGFDPEAFKKILEGFISKIDEWDKVFARNTDQMENLYARVTLIDASLQEISQKIDFMRAKLDPDFVGDTPITDYIAAKLEHENNGKEQPK